MATPTTTLALAAAFRTALEALTPRHEHERVSTWRFTPGPRSRGTALHLLGTDLRSFDFIFEPASVAPSGRRWFGNGTAYTCRLRICTSYSNVPPDLRDHMIIDDGVDLDRMFKRLTEPTTPGFGYAEYRLTSSPQLDDQANAMVEHLFDIYWSQNTD